jgi:hypothetical protein
MLRDIGCALRNILQSNAPIQAGQEIGVDEGGCWSAQFMYLMRKIKACKGSFSTGMRIKAYQALGHWTCFPISRILWQEHEILTRFRIKDRQKLPAIFRGMKKLIMQLVLPLFRISKNQNKE